jgi:hypothetical protein
MICVFTQRDCYLLEVIKIDFSSYVHQSFGDNYVL